MPILWTEKCPCRHAHAHMGHTAAHHMCLHYPHEWGKEKDEGRLINLEGEEKIQIWSKMQTI